MCLTVRTVRAKLGGLCQGKLGCHRVFEVSPNGLKVLPTPLDHTFHLTVMLQSRGYGLNNSLQSVIEAKNRTEKLSLGPVSFNFRKSVLAFSYSEHLGATRWAYALGCRSTILHGYRLSILHLLFGTAFHTVCLH